MTSGPPTRRPSRPLAKPNESSWLNAEASRGPLESVDLSTREPALAAYERSDVCVVPAAGVIGEAMVAIVLAQAFLEKFGGDSLVETKRNFDGYMEQVKNF